MNNTKMLQALIDGQRGLKEVLLDRISAVDQKVTKLSQKVDQLDTKIDKVEAKLTKRLDKIGLQLAYLEDDAPTKEEFEELVQRVDKLEHHIASA